VVNNETRFERFVGVSGGGEACGLGLALPWGNAGSRSLHSCVPLFWSHWALGSLAADEGFCTEEAVCEKDTSEHTSRYVESE
jgi:hypothetical protein